MKKLFNIFLVLFLFNPISSFPQIEQTDLLETLQLKFDGLDGFSVEFKQSNNGRNNLSGVFYFKKENNIKIVSERFIIVSNGETSWNYNIAENKVIISNFDEADPGVFSLNEIVYNFPGECTITYNNSGEKKHIILTPNTYKYNFDSVKLWLNNDNLIESIVIIDSVTGETGVEFSNYNLKHDLIDAEFTFIPPEGSKIIDLR